MENIYYISYNELIKKVFDLYTAYNELQFYLLFVFLMTFFCIVLVYLILNDDNKRLKKEIESLQTQINFIRKKINK